MTARQHLAATLKALGGRRFRAVATTETPDRMGDVIRSDGLDLVAYRRNPVVLLHHDASRIVGRADVTAEPGRVVADIELAAEGTSKDADEAAALVEQKMLGAVSIGFRSLDARPREGGGLEFVRSELLEISLVSVPANAEALIQRRLQDIAKARARARLTLARARA